VANTSLGRLVIAKRATGYQIADRITLFTAPAAAASTGEEQTQTSPENGGQITLPDFRKSPIYFGGC